MRYKLLTALGVLTAIAGLANSVQAQSTVASNSETGKFTLSGESLAGIESRTVGDDSNIFFLDDSSSTTANRAGDNNNAIAQGETIGQISDDNQPNLQLFSSQPTAPPFIPVPWRQNEPFTNTERVQVQIGID